MEHDEDEDISPELPSDSEMSEDGDLGYNSIGKQGISDHTENKATERANLKEGSMSWKVKTLFKSIGIPRSPLSKKVGRLLKSKPKLLELFMNAYVDAKSYLPQANNARVDGMADSDASSTHPLVEETEGDDRVSEEQSTVDYENEQQPDDDSSAADFEFGDHTLDGKI